ncbi:MAG: hypothetical protein U0939_12700 [Pirellulales bacterium]
MRRISPRFLTIAALVVCGTLTIHGPTATADDKPIPLHVAVQKGLVDVEVVGRGASTGDSVQVRVQRKGNQAVSVSVDPGTVIQPKGAGVQTMALAGVKYKQVGRTLQKAEAIELSDDQPQTYILEGYCRDIEKPTPTAANQFAVDGPDADNAKVLVHAKKLGATVKVTQSAIWIQRSKLSDGELKRYFQVSDDELDAARKLLVSVESQDEAQEVDVKVVLDRLRKLAVRAPGDRIRRGDTVEVASGEAELKARVGDKSLGVAKQGDQLEVLGVQGADSLIVRIEVDGKRERALIKTSDVKLAKAASRPVLNAVLNAAEEAKLEVFDKSP